MTTKSTVRKILAAGVLFAAYGVAYADEEESSFFGRIADSTQPLSWAIASGFESRHVGGKKNLNDHNPGLGLRFPGGWVLGAYYNSFRRHSVYAGKEFQWRLLGKGETGLNFGVVAGVVSGYEGGLSTGQKYGIHLMAIPEAVVTARYGEVVVGYVPKTDRTPTTFALQLRIKWP